MITGLIIAGLVIDLGGGPDRDRRGFRVSQSGCISIGITVSCDCWVQYWNNPGALAPANLVPSKPHLDKFLAILTQIVQAAFSFQGMELVCV